MQLDDFKSSYCLNGDPILWIEALPPYFKSFSG